MRLRATRVSATGGNYRSGDPYGRTFLADASTGLLLPGFAYTRSGPDLWCPQADGSLTSFAANVIPREWANGRWGFRFDPGWTQSFLRTHELSHAAWGLTGLQAPQKTALGPNGANDSWVLVETTAAATGTGGGQSMAVVAGQSYTIKLICSSRTGNRFIGVVFTTAGFGANLAANINPADGTVTVNSGSVTAGSRQLANGNWELWATATATATASVGILLRLSTSQTLYFPNYTGDGVSGVNVHALNFTNTAYPVPLTVAQGTAGTVGNFSAGWDASALPFALSGGFSFGGAVTVLNRIANQYPSVINFRPDGISGSNETVEVFASPVDKQLFALVRTGGVDTYGQSYIASSNTSSFAQRAAANNFRSAFNGVLQPEDLSGAMPATNYMQIGRNSVANLGAMHIQNLWVTKRLLTGQELTTLSS